jgi:hypothetical protein
MPQLRFRRFEALAFHRHGVAEDMPVTRIYHKVKAGFIITSLVANRIV